MADLGRRVVAFLEARRGPEMASLVERHNGVPYSAPCLQEIHRPEAPDLAGAVERLCADDIQVVVFLTGVGANTILEAARARGREQELLAALHSKLVAVRGPKPTAVLRRAGVRIDVSAPPPNTTRELLAALEPYDLADKWVAVQLYGGPNPELRRGLEGRRAQVFEISPYVWDRAADPEPIRRLIADLQGGSVDVLACTSASQVDILFATAREIGQEEALRRSLQRVPVAAQGPVCAAALERHGVAVAIRPEHGHMGALVLAMARHFEDVGEPRAEVTGGRYVQHVRM